MSHHQVLPTSRRLIPFACAGDAAGMQTNTTYPTPGGVDREQLDRQITEMYRDVANEAGRDLHFPTGRPLAEAVGYPPRCAHGMNSFTDRDYGLALARLRRG